MQTVSIILSLVAISAGFAWQYIGNERFHNRINSYMSKQLYLLKAKKPVILFLGSSVLIVLLLFAMRQLNPYSLLLAYALLTTCFLFYFKNKSSILQDVVSCTLGVDEEEKGKLGIKYVRYEDGDASLVFFEDRYVRKTDVIKKQRYIYFALDTKLAVRFRKADHVYVIIEFFDAAEHEGWNFVVQYASKDSKNVNPRFKTPENEVIFEGSDRWQLGVFKLEDVEFKRSQHDGIADFRIRCPHRLDTNIKPSDIMIRKVVMVSSVSCVNLK
jgi:hypothetical protein